MMVEMAATRNVRYERCERSDVRRIFDDRAAEVGRHASDKVSDTLTHQNLVHKCIASFVTRVYGVYSAK